MKNLSHGISACQWAFPQVDRKTNCELIFLDLEGGGNNQRTAVSPHYCFQEPTVRNLSVGPQVWSELPVTLQN